MSPLRIAVIGCGFWSRFQIPAWREVEAVKCVAVCHCKQETGPGLAACFNIPENYNDPVKLLGAVRPDAIDIVTSPQTHQELVELACSHRIPVICQKPMANDSVTAENMVRICSENRVPFFVHENWRWQQPIRELKRIVESGMVGRPFRARMDFNTCFPVFENQPSLRQISELILADLGVHLLDAARFLFGEAVRLTCHTHQINPGISGEDVATVLLAMKNGMTVTFNLSFASRLEFEHFPQTLILVEGSEGSVELAPDYEIRTTDRKGTTTQRCLPTQYSWADPDYALVHASIVECHRNLAAALRRLSHAETTGEDNLQTLKLVFACYESALSQRTIELK